MVEAALERKARDVAKQVARSPVAINRRLAEEATDEDYMVMHTTTCSATRGRSGTPRNAKPASSQAHSNGEPPFAQLRLPVHGRI